MEIDKAAYITAALGLFFIVLGMLYIIYEGVHEDICNNTKDIEYYERHCVEVK